MQCTGRKTCKLNYLGYKANTRFESGFNDCAYSGGRKFLTGLFKNCIFVLFVLIHILIPGLLKKWIKVKNKQNPRGCLHLLFSADHLIQVGI